MTTILIVDDVEDTAESLAELCEAMGHEAHVARDGAQAVALAAETTPLIVLLDLRMPDIDGFETARRLREAPGGSGMFIVALTGISGPGIARRTKAAGFDFHLTRPLDTNALLTLIEDLSARRRP